MINRELKIGDVVEYAHDPVKWRGKVIGFRGDGNIAILNTFMAKYVYPYGKTAGQTNQEFIWRFNVDSKGIITYNTMWSIVEPVVILTSNEMQEKRNA